MSCLSSTFPAQPTSDLPRKRSVSCSPRNRLRERGRVPYRDVPDARLRGDLRLSVMEEYRASVLMKSS